MDQETFERHVEDALAHLFDHFYLQFHPLAGLLAADAPPAQRGRTLSRVLVDAIERLKPGQGVPDNSLAWRKYHYISFRYVQAVPPDQLSRQLGVSDRQGRRDHRQALDALCTLLWDDYQALRTRTVIKAPADAAASDAVGSTSAETSSSDVESELLRLGRVAPRTACQLSDVIDGALGTTRPLLAQHECQVTLDVPRTIAPVAINPLILREIIIGLITYAADLARRSGVLIRATEAGPRNLLNVSVKSQGPLDDTTILSTMRRLAEMQGARLSVARDVSEGSLAVTLDLPVAERATVLVIDDNPDVVLLFRRYLGQTYRLVQATTADEALALAEELKPSLITLDVMMPGLDGWQILERLKRNAATSAIPVVVCSILIEPSLAQALGADAYLPKPIDPLMLRATLDRHLAPSQDDGEG